jgi:hypothetical protein
MHATNLCLLPSGNAQDGEFSISVAEYGYILPIYPPLAARAFLNADYELALEVEQGSIAGIKVISGQTAGLGRDFIESMERVIRKWRLKVESGIWPLRVSFRSVRTNSEEGKPTYYIYRVDESPFSSDGPPSKITIEYHHPVPELQGLSGGQVNGGKKN